MNNSMYTTIPPELDYMPIMSPEEEMDHYHSLFIEDNDYEILDIFEDEPIPSIRDSVAGMFCRQANIQVNAIDMHGLWGLEVHKTNITFVCGVLDLAGIHYTIGEARFKNIYGHWTHKSFNFIQITDEDFRTLHDKLLNEIVIIGEDIL